MHYFIHVTPSFIVLLLTSFIIIFFGVIVYKRSKQRWVNRTFTALTVCISLWMLSSTLADTLVDESAILFFSKLAIVGPILFAPFFTIFSYIFPNEKKKINKKLIALLFAPAVIALFFVPTKYNIESIQIKDWGTDFTPGHLYTFLFIYLIICFFGAMHFSLRNFKKCDGRERTQLTYLFLSIFLMISFGLTTNLILPLFFNYGNSSVYGPLSGLFFVIATSYAIVRQRLFGIKIVLTSIFVSLLIIFYTIDIIVFIENLSFQVIVSKVVVLVVIIIFGTFLIRSVKNEIEQRERVERLVRKLEVVNGKLEELDKAKTNFLSLASHQLRTPLTVIKGVTSMMLDGDYGKVSRKIKDCLVMVQQSSNRLIDLLEDFLNISRIELGRIDYKFENTNLINMIDDVVKELSIKIKDKKLKLIYNKPTRFPIVRIDGPKIREVIMNLIENAIKYNVEEGNLTICLRKIKNTIEFSVIDSGIGVYKNDISQVFKKFSRTENAMEHANGTGLGLYVVKEILKAHNGNVWAESKGINQGSKFYFRIPVK